MRSETPPEKSTQQELHQTIKASSIISNGQQWRKKRVYEDGLEHVVSCRNLTPCQCLCREQWAFAMAGGEECKGLFLTHLPGDRLPFWRTTHSLLCVQLTIETQAPYSERPHIPDLGHNKSPTGSLFLIAATRSASRPSYKHPLPVLLVLVSRPHLHDDWWRQPEVGDTSSSSTRIAPVLLRRVGSFLESGTMECRPIVVLSNEWNGRIYFLYVSKLGLKVIQHNRVQGYRVS